MAIAASDWFLRAVRLTGPRCGIFPDVDADIGMVDVQRAATCRCWNVSRCSAGGKRIFDMAEIQSLYTATFVKAPSDSSADVIGRIQIELVNWEHRPFRQPNSGRY